MTFGKRYGKHFLFFSCNVTLSLATQRGVPPRAEGLGTSPQPTLSPRSSSPMPQTATAAAALKELPDAAPAQVRTHARPRTAGRHNVAQPSTRPLAHRPHMHAGLRAGLDQLMPPTRGARHRPPAPTQLPRLPLLTHAARAHPAGRHGLGTHAPGCTQGRPRKQGFLHMAAARAGLRQQERGQCTWHWIGRLSSRRHGDRMSGRGAPWLTISRT